jgi:hypothetical protein
VLADETAVTWGHSSLRFDAPTIASTAVADTKILDACRQSGELTVEAWLRPASLGPFPAAPLRVVTLSGSSSERDFTFGQTPPGPTADVPFDAYTLRVRTTATDLSGTPGVHTPGGAVTLARTHGLATARAPGASTVFVDGVEVAQLGLAGGFSTWESYRLLLANELASSRPWLGELWLVAVYCRALDAGEARQNFLAGP